MAGLAYYHNQLLFNLERPVSSVAMPVKFSNPKPIIVEKFGPAAPGTHLVNRSGTGPPKLEFSFTSISEDKLSLAIQLAKRDVQKQREEEEFERSTSMLKKIKDKGKYQADARKARIVHSREYKEHVKRKQEREKSQKPLPIKTSFQNKGSVNQSTQYNSKRKPKTARSHAGIVYIKQDTAVLPVTTMSPPRRDTDPCRYDSHEERVMNEIQKLRTEIQSCLKQIKEIDDLAKKGAALPKPKPILGQEDLPPAELARRRAARVEEQAARTARILYSLQQQVRDIQADVAKLKPSEYQGNKKNQLLSRLASAHRGAVRTLKSLVEQLAEHDLTQGLPKAYHELNLLVRQLSLCCAQLEIGRNGVVPDSLTNLLKEMAEVNEDLEKQLHSSPAGRTSKSIVSKEIIIHGKGNDSHLGDDTAKKISQDVHRRAVGSSPEREAALRQGIMALMRAADESHAPPRRPRVPARRGPGKACNAPRGRKGLLLPSRLAARRGQAVHVNQLRQPVSQLSQEHPHYAGPTVSYKLKVNPPVDRSPTRVSEWPQMTSPERLVQATPARLTPRSPALRNTDRSFSARSRVPAGGPWDIAKKEIARQVWLDSEAMKKTKDIQNRQEEIEKLEELRSHIGTPTRWVEEAERKIKEELKPLLEQAKEIARKYREIKQKSLDQHLSGESVATVETNANVLANMILQDVLNETVDDLSRVDDEDDEGDESLLNPPGIETMVQRLKDMEEEQQTIRQRWATITFEDESVQRFRRAVYFDADGSECPKTPPPIELASASEAKERSTKMIWNDAHREMTEAPKEEVGAIMFTQPSAPGPHHESLHLSQHGLEHELPQDAPPKPSKDTRIPLYLSEEMIDSLEGYRVRFEEHLRRTSTQMVGRFNPWQLIEEMSNEILDDCLTDIAKELDDINNDIASHVYQEEFKVMSSTEEEPHGNISERVQSDV